MTSLIHSLPSVQDGDLVLCELHGYAYQRDMLADRVSYDATYLAKVDAYEDSAIAKKVNAGRCALLERHLYYGSSVLDIGAGSGAFVHAAINDGFAAKGFEVIPQGAERLRSVGLFNDDPSNFDAVTFWDSIEHMENPEGWMRRLGKKTMVFASLPIFSSLRNVRLSKHYRPGEHLHYFTNDGFIGWMALCGFRLIEQSNHETSAGRESIGAFAFTRIGR